MELYINDENQTIDFGGIVQFYNLDLIQKHVSSKIQVPQSFEEYSQSFMDDLKSIHIKNKKKDETTEKNEEPTESLEQLKSKKQTHDYIHESLCSIYEKEYYKISYDQFIALCNYIIDDKNPFVYEEKINQGVKGAKAFVSETGTKISQGALSLKNKITSPSLSKSKVSKNKNEIALENVYQISNKEISGNNLIFRRFIQSKSNNKGNRQT